MSIRPPYATGILEGTKQVEFRKRALADDIVTAVIYATAPVGSIVGEFEITGQVIATPAQLWKRFAPVAGIARAAFFEYFAGTEQAVGIMIGDVVVYDSPRKLNDVDPGGRPPQSFKYLTGV